MVIVWLLVWELSSQSGLDQRYIVPPSVMLRSFYRSVLVTGELRTHIWATVTRLLGGLVVGAIPAMWLGVVMGRNQHAWLRYSLFVAALGLIPVIASFPFSIVMFGVGDFQKWAMVAAAVFYPILYCTTKGVQISRILQAAANSPVEDVIRSDWLQGPGPWIFTGLKMGSVIDLATLLGVEMHTSTKGLGFEIRSGYGQLKPRPRIRGNVRRCLGHVCTVVVSHVHRTYVDEIVNGVKRDDITVEQSIKFALVSSTPNVLYRADKVIK